MNTFADHDKGFMAGRKARAAPSSDALDPWLLPRALSLGSSLATADIIRLQAAIGNLNTQALLSGLRAPADQAHQRVWTGGVVQRLGKLGNSVIDDEDGAQWTVQGKEGDQLPDSPGAKQRRGVHVQIYFLPGKSAPYGFFNLIQTTNLRKLDSTRHPFSGYPRRENLRTSAESPGVEEGWVTDIPHETQVAGNKASPYYGDFEGKGGGHGQTGHKPRARSEDSSAKPKVEQASLDDFPSASGPIRFQFETVATPQDKPKETALSSLKWGFDVEEGGSHLQVVEDYAFSDRIPSPSFGAALDRHLEHYGTADAGESDTAQPEGKSLNEGKGATASSDQDEGDNDTAKPKNRAVPIRGPSFKTGRGRGRWRGRGT